MSRASHAQRRRAGVPHRTAGRAGGCVMRAASQALSAAPPWARERTGTAVRTATIHVRAIRFLLGFMRGLRPPRWGCTQRTGCGAWWRKPPLRAGGLRGAGAGGTVQMHRLRAWRAGRWWMRGNAALGRPRSRVRWGDAVRRASARSDALSLWQFLAFLSPSR